MALTATVRIDPTRCRGHAICALFFAPGVELDRWGFGRVVEDEVGTDRLLRRAQRAAASCPNGAFTVTVHPLSPP